MTIETIQPMFDKELPGFDQMMRFFAYRDDCGVQSIAYRSCAGLIHQCLVFCLPGATNMIKYGMTQEVQVLAYEQDALLHRDYEQFEQNSECAFEGVDVTPLRAQKDEAELDATRRASIIADQAFAQVLPYIRPGVTERAISSRLESAM